MYSVQIPDQIYQQATQAAQANHLSVEEFVVEAVKLHLHADAEGYDHIFTPEVLAELDVAAAETRAGKSLTGKQVDAYLAENRTEWFAKHQD